MERAKLKTLDTQVGGTHYKGMEIEPLEFMLRNNIPYAEGSVIKYVTRWRKRGGIEDLEKAIHILTAMIELEQQRLSSVSTAVAAAKSNDVYNLTAPMKSVGDAKPSAAQSAAVDRFPAVSSKW